MWLLTPLGFYSIVQKPCEAELCIRARHAGDLDRLRARYLPTLTDTLETRRGDYRYRAWVAREALAEGLAAIARDLDYSNFKNEVARHDPERAHIYGEVWSVLGGIQPGGPYGLAKSIPADYSSTASLDDLFGRAVGEAAVTIPSAPTFREDMLEVALAAALRRLGNRVGVRRKFPIPNWNPQPGPVDLFVLDDAERLVAAAELKVYKTEESLWDVYKMIALGTTSGVEATYVIIPATTRRWLKPERCTQIFADRVVVLDSRKLFEDERPSWEWLLTGGQARPIRVPAKIRITPVERAPVEAWPTYELRAVRVEAVLGSGWLDFDGDWPMGFARSQ